MQLRDAGELSLDDPLTRILPESAPRPDDRPDARALLRAPARAARRDLGDDEGADRDELLAAPPTPSRCSTWFLVALLEPGVRAARRGGRPRARRHLGGGSAGARSSTRSGLGGRRPTGRPAARGYFVEPYSRRRSGCEPDLDLGGAGALGKLWSTTGDLARWGAFLAAGDDRVLKASTLEEMAHVRAMVDHEGWKLAWGTGLELYRRDDHVFVGHGGAMPGHLAGLVVNRKTKIGAAVLTNTGAGASPDKLAIDLAVAAIEALPVASDAWQPGEPAPAEIEPLLGRWWVEGSEMVFSWRKGRLEAKLVDGHQGGRPRTSSPRAKIASARSKGASAGSCCASSATPAARSRSSTSRRIRCAASRRRSSLERSPAWKKATRRRRRRRSGSRRAAARASVRRARAT
jgi:hypothetical protein